LHDAKVSEELTKLGVRTHRVAAVIELKELNFRGKVYPVESLKRLGFFRRKQLHEDFAPAISVRLFGTRTRAVEVILSSDAEGDKGRRREMMRSAIKLVAAEQGKEDMSLREYMDWFATTLGNNVGIMHKHGYLHGYLTLQNVTLDGRITDFDSVTRYSAQDLQDPKKEREISQHLTRDVQGYFRGATTWRPGRWSNGAGNTLVSFARSLNELFPDEVPALDRSELARRFTQAYLSHNPNYAPAD